MTTAKIYLKRKAENNKIEKRKLKKIIAFTNNKKMLIFRTYTILLQINREQTKNRGGKCEKK